MKKPLNSCNADSQLRNIKLPRMVVLRAPGLLPMLYSISELAKKFGVPYSTIRGWLDYGVPFEKDSRGRIWINGELFAGWVQAQKPSPKHKKLKANEGYCFHCNEAKIIENIETVHVRAKLELIRGTCQSCGNTVFKGSKYG
jgi:hypothetical protein